MEALARASPESSAPLAYAGLIGFVRASRDLGVISTHRQRNTLTGPPGAIDLTRHIN